MTSCNKHEVIPAPKPTVDLSTNFTATINGTPVEWTENVEGYAGIASQEKEIKTSPELSEARYYFSLRSTSETSYIQIGLGSVKWDKGASGSETPDLSLFNNFFIANDFPAYSDFAMNGFTVIFRNSNGNIYRSSESSVNFQNVSFSGIKQETGEDPFDATIGDYSKFSCNFDCYVYYTDPISLLTDSIRIQNAVLKGWFER